MKRLIARVLARGRRRPPGDEDPPPLAVSSELTSSDIESYYLRIISDMLRRMLVPADSVDVEVRRDGTGPEGRTAYAGYVRILRWEPVMPVLLQNAPVLDGKIRKVVAASVLLEHTHFAGLWFQATSLTEGAPQVLVGLPAQLVRQPGGG